MYVYYIVVSTVVAEAEIAFEAIFVRSERFGANTSGQKYKKNTTPKNFSN